MQAKCDFVNWAHSCGMLLNSVVLTGISGSLFSPIKNKESLIFVSPHSGLTPNDSTSNFQQRPNNPIPSTTIIFLWVLNNPVDYWSVQSHKDLQRLQGHLIYSVLWLKFPVAFWLQSSAHILAHILALHPSDVNKARVGTYSLSLWALLSFGYTKPFWWSKVQNIGKRVWKCVCVHWGWGNNWHSMVDMVNVVRGPNRVALWVEMLKVDHAKSFTRTTSAFCNCFITSYVMHLESFQFLSQPGLFCFVCTFGGRKVSSIHFIVRLQFFFIVALIPNFHALQATMNHHPPSALWRIKDKWSWNSSSSSSIANYCG